MTNNELVHLLESLSRKLKPHFRSHFLQRDLAVFQFQFDQNGSPFNLTVWPEDFEFKEGEHSSPTITLYVDNHELCIELLCGKVDGMEAFMNGSYRSDGNIVLSQLLLYLFEDQNPVNIYQVQD